ncbi:ABC transporter permease subunit [uncultured Aliivibrio sp.]|uniref:ABC transporter permease subunit n=1 Tax=uncultured Aliivibrio sp. TaxID=873085 RepID=UPI002635F10E|nr:ABC transporter permease subunit [uncultured Aliivibrio sp.]
MAYAKPNQRFRDKQRHVVDLIMRIWVKSSGVGIIAGLMLICFYLLAVIAPIFTSVTVDPLSQYSVSYPYTTLAIGSDEQGKMAYRIDDTGQVQFIDLVSKKVVSKKQIIENPTAFTSTIESQDWFAFGDSQGRVQFAQIGFQTNYSKGERQLIPLVEDFPPFPSIQVDENKQLLTQLALSLTATEGVILATTQDDRLLGVELDSVVNQMTGESVWKAIPIEFEQSGLDKIDALLSMVITPNNDFLYLLYQHELQVWKLKDHKAHLRESIVLKESAQKLTLLSGANSVLVQFDNGSLSQWFDTINNEKRTLTQVRTFNFDAPIVQLSPEVYRKGVSVIDEKGNLSLIHTTTEKKLYSQQLFTDNVLAVTQPPNAEKLIVLTKQGWECFQVTNPHPEVSVQSVFGKIWYEGYPEPAYIWQSTAANDDFESKFSLMPLAFGTLKAAFYALIFAGPIAIGSAIYTAYFMSSNVRRYVKPTIEIMEALPTVIIGLLAGIWLAPIVENNLVAVFSLFVLFPLSMMIIAFVGHILPAHIMRRLPRGQHAILLIPALLGIGYLTFNYGYLIESWLFNGDLRHYLGDNGVGYDQRNALVVGIAMGAAIIPTIYTIAEDAIFSVPKHLSEGSLALGATQWQTLTNVVLLTASPGIFSAVMMGLGRAVGETMIVLMATGNTPIMDGNILEGMRTLAANIAIEMPESEMGSTHFRMLFLAAFLLFVFTFFVNSLAEWIRQGLREKYRSL